MRALLFVLFVFLYCPGLFAQRKKFVTVKAGSEILEVLSTSDILYYPVFANGTVFRKDGSKVEARLNYNLLVDEMHFIAPAGDTLALANEESIRYIAVGKDTFVFNNGGYLRVIANGGRAKLALKETWVIADSRQVGPYNTTNTSAAITTYTSYTRAGSLYGLTINADLELKYSEQYYLGDQFNHFIQASKKNSMTLFPESERLEPYLKENKVDFKSEEDLTKLTMYLSQVN
jgi:hypothetical protein